MSILIYDNSPVAQPFHAAEWPLTREYHHDPANGGLAGAYNYALKIAQRDEKEWLLLLDQDTEVGAGLLVALFQTLSNQLPLNVCALVPKLIQNNEIISPQTSGRLRNHSVDRAFFGTATKPVTALNSGACLRVQATVAVGGFPNEYWLEYLDHIMFSRLQNSGSKVHVLDVTIQHNLSLQNLEAEMTVRRYSNVLAAEWKFVRETGWGSGPFIHRLRLLKRFISHAVRLRNKQYALQTLRSALSSRT